MADRIIPDTTEQIDKLTRRTKQANAVIHLLMIAMQSDGPPVEYVIENALWAATELLESP